MGAGKTTVGQALGRRLGWGFEDLDHRIERARGRTVAEIFRDLGEPAFRRAERAALTDVIEELRGGSARIVALGGGAFAKKENAAMLRASGALTIFLDAPVEELWQRCSAQSSETGAERPLLRSSEEFRRLYAVRRENYSKAALTIQTGSRAVEAIVAEIAGTLGLKEIATRTEQGDFE